MHIKQGFLKKKSEVNRKKVWFLSQLLEWRHGAVLRLLGPGAGVYCWANPSGSKKLWFAQDHKHTGPPGLMYFNLFFTAPHSSQLNTHSCWCVKKFGKGKDDKKVTASQGEPMWNGLCMVSALRRLGWEDYVRPWVGSFPGQHSENLWRKETDRKATGTLGANDCLL